MFFFALVSQVLSFYSLHISFFSPVISRDQYPQREQQTFPQDWEYYAILWSILWRYVCHTCLSLFFSVVLKFPEESLEKFLCWMFFFALVSQVLSFYSLHISFFSPVISRDQCPQREQQTFPQDWEYYAILWSILWRYVCHTCLSLFFSVVLKFPEESLEKFLCWMFFFALVSQVLSFYSLHISFFSPVISRDQCPQREQQTFPHDWECYAILWSILWRYVCHTCLSLFFSVVLKCWKSLWKVSVLDDCCSFFLLFKKPCFQCVSFVLYCCFLHMFQKSLRKSFRKSLRKTLRKNLRKFSSPGFPNLCVKTFK